MILSTKHPSFFALARHLDVGRETLYAYMREGEYSDIITRASERIQEYMVERMMDPDVKPPGIQFVLKNIHGWKDETEVKTTGSMTHQHEGNVKQVVEFRVVRPAPQPEAPAMEDNGGS